MRCCLPAAVDLPRAEWKQPIARILLAHIAPQRPRSIDRCRQKTSYNRYWAAFEETTNLYWSKS
uniref:hypothetical protein n=1 Tax=Trichocoleus desertorum TaxID=1481672 RepID=UPI0025B44084|nr:hypothetical protein [Trichocoleus desertorum]